MKKLLAALLVASGPVWSQATFQKGSFPVLCQTTEFVSKAIQEYKEESVWAAKEDDGVLVTLWQNRTTKSFTLVKTSPDGRISCIISSGTGFQD